MAEQRVVVVGGGLMGLSTAWALARAGARPVVLERFARGHTRGASHGATRNYNNAYADDRYLDLLARARPAWDALAEAGDPLLRLHGLATHGPASVITPIHSALTSRGVDARLVDPGEAADRWPGMRFDEAVLVTRDAGVVRADAALAALEDSVVALGGEVRRGVTVTGLTEEADGVRIALDGGALTADVAVVTSGAWTTELLQGVLPLPRLTVTEESPAHFAVRDPRAPWPSFNHVTGPAYPGHVYGMPAPGEGVKVGFHGVGPEVDPDDRPYRATHQAALRDYVREWFPGLDPATAVPISCTYTSTESSDFILDRVGRIVVGAGFSGHGFKFGPAVGEVLADLALGTAAGPRAFPLPVSGSAAT